jgi:hypothetical protein
MVTPPPPDQPANTVVFGFRFEALFRPILALVGVQPGSARVTLDSFLDVRFGPWHLRTPRSNVQEVQVTGPYQAWKVIGPHLSLADRGVTFGTTASRGVCICFEQPVPALFPVDALKHPAVTVTVDDVDGLVAALS